jgi:hypothetical protein
MGITDWAWTEKELAEGARIRAGSAHDRVWFEGGEAYRVRREWTCEYCGSVEEGKKCPNCGAPKPVVDVKSAYEYGPATPFPVRGGCSTSWPGY